jgi:hypothetical protein
MSIWTSKGSIITAAGFAVGLSGCNAGDGVFGMASQNNDNSRRNVSLSEVSLMEGRLTLRPPDGYCFDRRSLRPDFAVVARCDSLGGARSGDQPVGMITVAAAPAPPDPDLPAALSAIVPQGSEILAREISDDLALVQLRGEVPRGADERHWRGLVSIPPYLVALSAYAPRSGEFLDTAAPDALKTLAQRSVAIAPQVEDPAVMPVDGEAAPAEEGRNGVRGWLRDLFG